jgi:hypothetical protein
MGMWTTDNQDTLKIVLKAFGEASRKNYDGSYAFEAGYLESVIVSMLPLMPKRAQKIVIDDMVRATQKQEKEVIEKMSKETV